MYRDIIRILLLLGATAFCAGCAIEREIELGREVTVFVQAAVGLAEVVERHFEDTEAANAAALRGNLNLQFDLGGTPTVRLPVLFSASERRARSSVLAALKTYSLNLLHALDGERPGQLIEQGISSVRGLESLKPDKFNLSHSMDSFATRTLVSSLSGFARILLLPKRDLELASITKTAHPYIEKLALLLYLDIGSAEDQADSCRFSAPKTQSSQELENLVLCRGGLRSLMSTAIAADLRTWEQRISLISVEKKPEIGARSRYISHIFDLQKAGQQQDAAMEGTQLALTSLIKSHRQLMETLSGARQKSHSGLSVRSLKGVDYISSFAREIAQLQERAIKAGSFFLEERE